MSDHFDHLARRLDRIAERVDRTNARIDRVAERSARARPLSVEDRRAMLIDAVIPLLVEHGRSVTSRQIAERAGIAEGTIFRAFGDKESLVTAAIAKHMDPQPLRDRMAAIDPGLPLEEKIHTMIALMRQHFEKVFGMAAAIGDLERPPGPIDRSGFTERITALLEPDLARLNCSPARVGQIVRFLAFSASLPQMNDGDPISVDDLTEIVLHGIAGAARPGPSGRGIAFTVPLPTSTLPTTNP